MRKWTYVTLGALLASCAAVAAFWITGGDDTDRGRYEREETEVLIANPARAPVRLFRAGESLSAASEMRGSIGSRVSLGPGNYFIGAAHSKASLFYSVPILGYNAGPERDGSLLVTVRPLPEQRPPILEGASQFVFIPGGHFLLGDRASPREIHYVWVTGFFMAPFETTNAEFQQFLNGGYADDGNWTEDGRRWRTSHRTGTTAALRPGDAEYGRFGKPGHPVVNVTWYEANAYCRWLTVKLGGGVWIFGLPTDAEWEKAARGPDNFDYGLSMTISDREAPLYNWKKNPEAPVTVVDEAASRAGYLANRHGLYHMSGNVAEWTQSIFRPYGKDDPYADDVRNRDDAPGRRTARGGSWYSATTAPLYLPYRDAFQPDHENNDLGFRVVARLP
ncbi:MAG: formylglycine-generating enzyme family protein [Acidobacteriia bacterium]|nr:formylglycine-generating enzyme family protein [Terriglobia bacterium]